MIPSSLVVLSCTLLVLACSSGGFSGAGGTKSETGSGKKTTPTATDPAGQESDSASGAAAEAPALPPVVIAGSYLLACDFDRILANDQVRLSCRVVDDDGGTVPRADVALASLLVSDAAGSALGTVELATGSLDAYVLFVTIPAKALAAARFEATITPSVKAGPTSAAGTVVSLIPPARYPPTLATCLDAAEKSAGACFAASAIEVAKVDQDQAADAGLPPISSAVDGEAETKEEPISPQWVLVSMKRHLQMSETCGSISDKGKVFDLHGTCRAYCTLSAPNYAEYRGGFASECRIDVDPLAEDLECVCVKGVLLSVILLPSENIEPSDRPVSCSFGNGDVSGLAKACDGFCQASSSFSGMPVECLSATPTDQTSDFIAAKCQCRAQDVSAPGHPQIRDNAVPLATLASLSDRVASMTSCAAVHAPELFFAAHTGCQKYCKNKGNVAGWYAGCDDAGPSARCACVGPVI